MNHVPELYGTFYKLLLFDWIHRLHCGGKRVRVSPQTVKSLCFYSSEIVLDSLQFPSLHIGVTPGPFCSDWSAYFTQFPVFMLS